MPLLDNDETTNTTQQISFSNSLILQKKTRQNNQKNLKGLQDDNRKKGKKKHWKPFDNLRYLEFLRRYGNLFQKDREDKRLMKINMMMSNFIKSKSSTQCRSHHQKMLIHYKSINGIIENLQRNILGQRFVEEKHLSHMQTQTQQDIDAQEQSNQASIQIQFICEDLEDSQKQKDNGMNSYDINLFFTF